MTEFKIPENVKPGFYPNIPNEAYHDAPGVSKSVLWTIYSSTPAHFKFPPPPKEKTAAQLATLDFGTAVHTAILEPNEFEARIVRGPADRRGNKWKDLAEACALDGRVLLIEDAYDNAIAVRDTVHADAWLSGILTGGKPAIEHSGFYRDPMTNTLCRFRPDFYREDIGIMIDVKTTASARADDFAKSVVNFGYHAQEAFYTDGLAAIGKPVEGTIFIALEKESPFAFSVFELPPSIVEDGRQIMRKALNTYADCNKSGVWPGYPQGVQELKFKRWSYAETEAPAEEETA